MVKYLQIKQLLMKECDAVKRLTSNKVRLGSILFCTALTLSCRSPKGTQNQLSSEMITSPPAKHSACVSLQGNGAKWPALLGEVAALMERDIDPVLIQGGSSGSLAAVVLRSILTNKSVQQTPVRDESGGYLSDAQKASMITTAMVGPLETLVFLPPLNRLSKVILDIVKYQLAVKFADAFIGLPEQQFAHLEAVTSQAVLLGDFARNADFSQVLQEADHKTRLNMTMQQWIQFADLELVKPGQFLNALLSPAPRSNATATAEEKFNEEIKTRYFHLFRTENLEVAAESETPGSTQPDQSLASYNKFLSRVGFVTQAIPEEILEKAFITAINSIKNIPFIGGFAATASKPFYMPSHRKLWNAYQGLTTTGKPHLMPSGTILHTTARKAKKRLLGSGNIEKTGLDHFYMVYFPSEELFDDVRSHYSRLADDESFMQYPMDDGHKVVLPKKNLLILGPNEPLSYLAKVSIAEPGLMRRDPMKLSAAEINDHNLSFNQNQDEVLISYGGWLDHLAPATFMRFDACKNADYAIQVATPFGREGLRVFQRQAIRAVIDGAPGSLLTTVKPDLIDDPSTPTGDFMIRLGEYMAYSATLDGKKGRMHLDYDWDQPDSSKDADFNAAMLDHRPSLFISAYQQAAQTIEEALPSATVQSERLPAATLMEQNLFELSSGAEVIATANSMVGELVPKQ